MVWKARCSAARSTCTASTRRCAASARRSTRSWTSMPSASWWTRSIPATACSARCTACTSRCPGASRTTSRSPRPTATSRCTPRCSACTACPSRSRSAPAKWKRWPTTASPRTGCTNPTRMKCPRAPTPAHGNGSRACWRCSSAPATRWSSSRTSRSTCSRTRSTSSRPRATSWSCPRAPPRSTSPTRYTPMSATPASPAASTVAWRRCRNRWKAARRWRSSPHRGLGRTRRG